MFIITRKTTAFGGISLALRGSGAFGGGKKNKKIGAPVTPQVSGAGGASCFGRLRLPIVFYSGRTDRITEPSSTVLVYRYG